jgi:heme exporter protein B
MLLKEILVELKTREIISSTAVFALLVVVFSAFAFDANSIRGSVAASGSLWLAVCFGGVMAVGRMFLKDREMDVWTGLILSPASRTGIYAAKFAGLFLFLLVISLLLLPVIQLFFHAPVFDHILIVGLIIVTGLLGFCAAGALFGTMIVRTSARDLMLGIVLLPIVSPLLILSVKSTAAILDGAAFFEISGYFKLTVVLDIIYLSMGLWLFEHLADD